MDYGAAVIAAALLVFAGLVMFLLILTIAIAIILYEPEDKSRGPTSPECWSPKAGGNLPRMPTNKSRGPTSPECWSPKARGIPHM